VGSYLHANYSVSLTHVLSVGTRISLACVECASDHVVTASTSKAQPETAPFDEDITVLVSDGCRGRYVLLIPFPYQIDFAMYGNDVMDLTSAGLRSM
jgi:hypothetical protein